MVENILIEGILFIKMGLRLFFGKFFNRVRVIGKYNYILIDDYKKDLEDINHELVLVEDTIKYYEVRRSVLLDWKHLVELKIARYGEADICCNCRFYSKGVCSLFDSSVNSDATCDDFEWKDDDIKLL
jgi:hypothetical protein